MDLPGLPGGHDDRPSPITKLPHEILTQIFFHSLGTVRKRPSADTPPLILGQICRSWRAVALSTPLLWAAIMVAVTVGVAPLEDLEKTLLAVEELLTRSQDCPLKISLVYMHMGDEQHLVYEKKSYGIVAKLVQHTHRWKNVVLSLPKVLIGQVFERISADARCLQSLVVSESDGMSRSSMEAISLSCAPQLECFHILLLAQVDWGDSIMHKMRQISVKFPTIGALLECLDRCPSLTDFDFYSHAHPPFPLAALQTRFSARRLSSVVYCSPDRLIPVQFSVILDCLDLPALKKFVLSTSMVPSDPLSLMRFLYRSHPPLEVLSINVFGMTTTELHECLRMLPVLTTLRCGAMHFSGEKIEPFLVPSPPHGEPILCPNVESVWIIDDGEVACRAVAKLVVNRQQNALILTTGARRIRVFGLAPSNWGAFKEYPGIQHCMEEGLQLIDRASWFNHRRQQM
ncbi:hypothetical protein BD410DRAFT_362537 [Rickenella mellea]|uniref:Uncharacterized protein n=1 Tax=Rickenella mellea TaxID=50990 RepID=A0A4Y7Q008_9AGAM|nr:hypothetical protein BD410DRAFT_362537 [Rickenella mellea]